MDAIVLVGGFGTRLLPLTNHLPKPLIPLVNKPFVERTVEWLRHAGVDHVILSLHYSAERFVQHFSDRAMDIDISFATEDTPLGTGGAIKNCERFLRGPRCFIFNGDIFTNLNLRAMLNAHQRVGAGATIALKEVDDPSRFGVIETDRQGRVLAFTEKPPRELARSRDVNTGVYIFERNVFDSIPHGHCSVEREIFPALLKRRSHIQGYREQLYWTDLGTPTDYLQAHRDILTGRVSIPLPYREISPGVRLGDGVEIADGALVRPPVIIGHRAIIADGATVGPMAVLGDCVRIERNSLVEGSVLWEGAQVLEDSLVQGCILGRGACVSGVVNGGICEDHGVLDGMQKKVRGLFKRHAPRRDAA